MSERRRLFWFYTWLSWDGFIQPPDWPWWSANRLWFVGGDEFYRRTLVLHLPFIYPVIVTSRPHPEWADLEWEALS